jgi:hypothetical protein
VQRTVGHIVGPYGATTRVYDIVLSAVGANPSRASGRQHP